MDNTKSFKGLVIILVLGIIGATTVAWTGYSVSAQIEERNQQEREEIRQQQQRQVQQQTQNGQTEEAQQKWITLQQGRLDLMQDYLDAQKDGNLTKEEWQTIHGQMYDFMTQNGINPGLMMGFGKTIMEGMGCPNM